MSEPFEIELRKGEYSLRAKGLKPISQVGQYVADAIGIIGEPLGYLKDSLHNFRIHREASAAAAMIRAKEIANSEGRQISNVSTKFLASWIEGASRENINDENNILELWSLLLARSEEDFDPMFAAFMDVLQKIGPSEAKILDNLIDFERPTSYLIESNSFLAQVSIDEKADKNDKVIAAFCGLYNINIKNHAIDTFDCLKYINNRLIGEVTQIEISKNGRGISGFGSVRSYRVLESAGVLKSRKVYFRDISGKTFCADLFETSFIGVELVSEIKHDSRTKISEDLIGFPPRLKWVYPRLASHANMTRFP